MLIENTFKTYNMRIYTLLKYITINTIPLPLSNLHNVTDYLKWKHQRTQKQERRKHKTQTKVQEFKAQILVKKKNELLNQEIRQLLIVTKCL